MQVRLMLLASVAALAAGVAAAVVVGKLVAHTLDSPIAAAASAPPSSPTTSSAPPSSVLPTVPVPAGFPVPPAGAVVIAREAGPNVLALAVARDTATVSVVGQNGKGVSGASVLVDGARTSPCGLGCYRAPAAPGPISVVLRAGGLTTSWRVDLNRDAPSAASLVAKATTTFDALHALAWSDVLGSSAQVKVATNWQAVAPNRLAYQVKHGPKAVIIGDTRWDKFTQTSAWQQSQNSAPIRQPLPFWESATDAHVLGQTTFAGKRVTEISFFDPKTPGWFQIFVDPTTLRTFHMDMYATAHFMHDTYFGFNATQPVAPPTG
jgi:hypothetical protein